MSTSNTPYDVVIVGAGNAALCAAIAACERGARTLVLEKAPEYFRGGNTYFTGGIIRCAYNGIEDIKALIPDMTPEEEASVDVGKYTEDEFYSDLMRVTEGLADPELAQILVSQSHPTLLWLREKGVRFVLAFGRQAFKKDGKYHFWGGLLVESVGAGKGLSDQQFEVAERLGAEIRYQTKGIRLIQDKQGKVCGVVVQGPEGFEEVYGKTVVLASGGFEANAEMRTRYLGPGWELAKVRGVPYNTGDGIRMALDIGAQSHGHWSSCHAVAWDVNAPPFGDRNITELFQKHSYPFGLIVNLEGKRFVDEGADFRNYTYAAYGREILKQPLGAAFQIFDDKVKHLLRDEYRIAQVTMATANTIEELADRLGINRDGFVQTVQAFNAAVQPGPFDPTVLDGKCTKGITPPKSNWALPIDTPPFIGYGVTCGITFTFGGLKINARGQVMDTEGNPMPGLYAAGELVGGLFYHNYPGGSGLAAGAVFGRLAGASAAEDALGKA
ncbi:MAG TPA: FAD-dependent tricarballylate dehydrogenase TcuA [Alphaproteobacteria bacterium]|nr:FAD-dependent tricarballylate dehydrogenase TcuA [Alphaproteobacteria bacterium]